MSRIVPGRALAVADRNLTALRLGRAYALTVATGIAEPLMYLASIGFGVGSLVGGVTLPGGHAIPYEDYVAPAMLSVAAMSGVLTETTYGFFSKLRHTRIFDAILATPVRPLEIVVGEIGWALIRSSAYTLMFLGVMVALHLATPARAVVAFPAAMLVGLAFATLGMATSTFLRDWQDFDLLAAGQSALVLFSGTFFPIGYYPPFLQALVRLTPLYQGIELLRIIILGHQGTGLYGHIIYLLAATAASLVLAIRRMKKLLYT